MSLRTNLESARLTLSFLPAPTETRVFPPDLFVRDLFGEYHGSPHCCPQKKKKGNATQPAAVNKTVIFPPKAVPVRCSPVYGKADCVCQPDETKINRGGDDNSPTGGYRCIKEQPVKDMIKDALADPLALPKPVPSVRTTRGTGGRGVCVLCVCCVSVCVVI